MKRVCPLLERETRTRVLPYAPPPWVLRQCLETGFVFLENPPEYERLRSEYAWEVVSQQQSARRQHAEPRLQAISAMLKTFRQRVLRRSKLPKLSVAALRSAGRRHAGDLHLLDVGCGWGGLLPEIVSRLPGAERTRCVPYGIEISAELARIATQKLPPLGGGVINDAALDGMLRFEAGLFDLVVLSSFLEHEVNPLPLLRRCAERLRPHGAIVVKVPNFASFNRVMRGARWCGFRWPEHVNHFTPHTLRLLAERAGLRVLRMTPLDRHPLSDNMYAVLARPAAPQPAANGKPRVLVADTPAAMATVRAALEEFAELVPAFTFEQALLHLRAVDIVICGLHFDDARMFDLLQSAKQDANAHVPFLCIRAADGELSVPEYSGLRRRCVSLGALQFLDLDAMKRAHGPRGGYRQFGRVVLAYLRSPGRAIYTAQGV